MGCEEKRKVKMTPNLGLCNLQARIAIYVVKKSRGEAELSIRKEFSLDILFEITIRHRDGNIHDQLDLES